MAAGERLHFDHHLHEESKLASRECLLVVVFLPADRTSFGDPALGGDTFETLEALRMEDV